MIFHTIFHLNLIHHQKNFLNATTSIHIFFHSQSTHVLSFTFLTLLILEIKIKLASLNFVPDSNQKVSPASDRNTCLDYAQHKPNMKINHSKYEFMAPKRLKKSSKSNPSSAEMFGILIRKQKLWSLYAFIVLLCSCVYSSECIHVIFV